MKDLLDALHEILEPQRHVLEPVVLEESTDANKCAPLHLKSAHPHWALRLQSDDHLRVLAPLAAERSVRKLPDYLVFSEPPIAPERPEDVALRVLVCELKSSATGAEKGLAQVQLGKLLAEYLVRIAAHSLGGTDMPRVWCSGLIASPQLPSNLLTKGTTRPGKVEPPNRFDSRSRMRIFYSLGGQELHLESLF
jgi:hypothetical protein